MGNFVQFFQKSVLKNIHFDLIEVFNFKTVNEGMSQI